ncbi:hypothetical protein [Massilia sp. TSP1-1-2]|uniref:hypothetical protein n=1 Tax=unclassified Massilia TaxID=2609279 RepID=UPI003CEB79F0
MTDTTFFWQGGRKIAVRKDDADITIRAATAEQAQQAAARAGVNLLQVQSVAPGLVRATVPGPERERVGRRHARGPPCRAPRLPRPRKRRDRIPHHRELFHQVQARHA